MIALAVKSILEYSEVQSISLVPEFFEYGIAVLSISLIDVSHGLSKATVFSLFQHFTFHEDEISIDLSDNGLIEKIVTYLSDAELKNQILGILSNMASVSIGVRDRIISSLKIPAIIDLSSDHVFGESAIRLLYCISSFPLSQSDSDCLLRSIMSLIGSRPSSLTILWTIHKLLWTPCDLGAVAIQMNLPLMLSNLITVGSSDEQTVSFLILEDLAKMKVGFTDFDLDLVAKCCQNGKKENTSAASAFLSSFIRSQVSTISFERASEAIDVVSLLLESVCFQAKIEASNSLSNLIERCSPSTLVDLIGPKMVECFSECLDLEDTQSIERILVSIRTVLLASNEAGGRFADFLEQFGIVERIGWMRENECLSIKAELFFDALGAKWGE